MSSDVFQELTLFQDLSPVQLNMLEPLFVPYNCHTGTVVFEQGEQAEYLYLVVSGEVAIRYKPEDGPRIKIATIRPGGVVGWSALIGKRFYTSAVECSTYTQLLRLSGTDLQSLCEQHPKTGTIILERLVAIVAERLRITNPEMYELLESSLRHGVNYPGG